MRPAASVDALCHDEIDAFLLLSGYPSPVVDATRRGCPMRLFGVEGPAIDQLVAASPYYRHTVVPASAYGFGADIKTFGSAATLVTSTHVADAVVHAIAKAVLGHLDEFGALAPTMVGMTPAEMIHDSLTAPLHPGAERAYRELGLMR